MTRVAVVEPFLGGSHRAWANGYRDHSTLDVHVFGLPAVHWKWRMHGAHVTLADQLTVAEACDGPFDAVIASDMCNVAGLLGVWRPQRRPTVIAYFHENQLTFPRQEHDLEDLTYPMVNWTTMVAADRVVFNSEFHRRVWFAELPELLKRLPDHRHSGFIAEVRARSDVLPVGIDLHRVRAAPRRRGARALILWNQRWEWDKGNDRFVDAVFALDRRTHDFDVALAGPRGSGGADVDELRRLLGERLVHDGLADDDQYPALLSSADVVVSTARHEFFGVALTEAVAAGAMPVAPDELVYPERIVERHHERCLYRTQGGLIDRLAWAVAHRDEVGAIGADLADTMDELDWRTLAERYDDLVKESVSSR